jgi:tRNA dimethylallyltransferase
MESGRKNKVVVILGPTSSGKSDLAIKIAKKFNGEIISADSRQIYRGMNIGSGKIHGIWSAKKGAFISQKIPHYMIDIASPKTNFNAAQFQKKAKKITKNILRHGKLPIICGGTGFWIKALVDDINFPEVKPNWTLRKKLEKYSAQRLFLNLKKLDPKRAENIDPQNKVRLIRAIEICQTLGQVPTSSPLKKEGWDGVKFLQLGIDVPKEKLHKNIQKRLAKRFKEGMLQEVANLHFKNKISWKKLESFGLEYRMLSEYLQKKISKKEMEEKLFRESKNYAKRQMTWFQKDSRIKWIKKTAEAEKIVKKFLV